MRQVLALRSKALSPYAQALKLVALKGAVAVGPSAKEMELEMYRKGTLPPDYRPLVQGKWDDTIERWAYAWQYPAEEEFEDAVALVEKNNVVMQKLLNFSERILAYPPSVRPGSGKDSAFYRISSSIITTEEKAKLLEPSFDYTSLEASVEAAANMDASVTEMISSEEFSKQTSIPSAYLDDHSEKSNASKELGMILEESSLEYTEDGLITVISALSRQHYYDAARAVFDFASQVGLGPSAEHYKALMKHSAIRGDVNQSMELIEEMKKNGITPRIGNWHELMRSFHHAKDYPAVSQIVDNMKMYANIEPNEVTFALQLRALSKDTSQKNSLAEAIQLFDQMENVYGYIAARPHYDALMSSLSQSPLPEMRLRCEELAKKMDLMGISWNATTYLNLVKSCQVTGDVGSVEKYLAKMRDDCIPVGMLHLSWSVQAHVQFLIRLNYEELKEQKTDLVSIWLEHMSTCFGIYEIVVGRGWEMQLPFLNALLRLCCQTTILCMEHLASDTVHIGRFEDQSNKIWNDTFDEWSLKKDAYSYECYIALLAHQQRIAEAEKLFQEMILRDDLTPSRRTYECLIFMHLSSGEEGGAARALHFLQAMEKSKIPIRPSLLKKIVRVNNAAGYKRDMKRRARRIMQAREEYLAKKQEGLGHESDVTMRTETQPGPDSNGDCSESTSTLEPLPIAPDTTLAWWERWKKETISKHELFEEENADGTPKGEAFEQKNLALSNMGINSPFKSIEDVPSVKRNGLLSKIRETEGEMAGSLWGLDGGELSYPKDGGGPQGWGVRLWRERAILRKEFQRVQDGKAPVPEFSELGKSMRVVGDQLDIEKSAAKSPAELSDWREYPEHCYEKNVAKPASEMAHPVQPSAEFVWQAEKSDPLAPYKSDEELAMQADNTFYAQLENDALDKTCDVVQVLQKKQENEIDIVGKGTTRRSKYDYLEKWREMYRHGTLEVPETPLLRYGRSADDHHQTMAATIRDWYRRNKKSPATEDQVARWVSENQRESEAKFSIKKLKQAKRARHLKQRPPP